MTIRTHLSLLFLLSVLFLPVQGWALFEFRSCGVYDMSGKLFVEGEGKSKTHTLVLFEGSLSKLEIPLIVTEEQAKELDSISLPAFKAIFRIRTIKRGSSPGPAELLSYRSRTGPGAQDKFVLVQARECK